MTTPALPPAKPEYRFDLNRVVIIGPFGQPFEPSAGFRPKPWHTIVPIEPRLISVQGREKLQGGLCSVGFEAKVACQATIEYVRRFYRVHSMDKLLAQDRLEKYVTSAIQREIAATSWDELMTEKGLLEAETRINKSVEKDLLHNSIDGTCSCHIAEPQVHGLDADGKAPRLVLGGDAVKRLEAESHRSEIALQEQRRQQDLERNAAKVKTEDDRDAEAQRGRAAELARRKKKDEADKQDRDQDFEDLKGRNDDDLRLSKARDAHERAVQATAMDRKVHDTQMASKAEISQLQVELEKGRARAQMESNLRQEAISAGALDEQFLEHETRMLKLETERARAERERADVQKHAEQAIEKREIELLKERIAAEHSWEMERFNRQLEVFSQAFEKLGGVSQPVERMSIVQFPSGDGPQMPNSPTYQISQAILVIRELLKVFADQK